MICFVSLKTASRFQREGETLIRAICCVDGAGVNVCMCEYEGINTSASLLAVASVFLL